MISLAKDLQIDNEEFFGRDLLSLEDYTPEQIHHLLELASYIKDHAEYFPF